MSRLPAIQTLRDTVVAPGRGVYAIECVDGRAYVGSSKEVRARRNHHASKLRKGKHRNRPLQGAWDELGPDAFRFRALEYVAEGDLIAAEQRWIDKVSPENRFNRAPNAGSVAGIVHTEETRAKNAAAKLGRRLSSEHRASIGAGQKGKTLTADHCAKLSAAKAGEGNASAKLRESDVLAIRGLARIGEPQVAIAQRFGICLGTVSLIVTRRSWKHIKDQPEGAA